MKWTKTHLFTLKEAPSDAEIPSHKLMVRGGFIKKLSPGLYTYGFMGLRAIRKFENIIRDELNRIDCIEILMPVVHPKELWSETNRWNEMGAGLLKFKNRNDHEFCLAATHEEAVVDYVRHDLKSWRDFPKNIYQIQTKYRDEIRPRFGLMRGREFSMKDAYSFDLDQAGALKAYQQMYDAYSRIFNRLGLQFRIVQADAGNIGGSQTHEFQLLAEAGEDALLVSDKTSFAANIEVCPAIDAIPYQSKETALKATEKFATPGQKTIADLEKFTQVPANELVKTLFFSANEGLDPKDKSIKAFAVLLRGSDEVNPIKVKNLLKMTNPPLMLTDEEVREASGANPGSCGPVGLKIPVYADNGIQALKNYIVGANEDGFHLKNVNHDRDYKVTQFADLRMAKEGDKCPESDGRLKSYRGIEVGHVFYLGQKYAQKMNGTFLDKNGKSQFYEMGCYGIGVTRTVQACIEQSHDADGIIWPISVAPYHVHICALDIKDETLMKYVEKLDLGLSEKKYDVFIDDRDERPGIKFKDADLLGFPVRIVVGKKGFEAGQIEVVNRKTKEVVKCAPDDVFAAVEKILGTLKLNMTLLKNPLIFALDVDSEEEAFKRLKPVIDLVGGVKIGPRLAYRYGAPLVQKIAEQTSVFVDNKYFDIPSTMRAAVKASFDAGATLVTVHALSGSAALKEMAQLEVELNRIRPFKILAVTILTSWDASSLPASFHSWSVENHVKSLSELVYQSGVRGLVCSGHELDMIPQQDFFKVVPGIRLSSDRAVETSEDQKRIMTPKQAMKAGAQALVIGRPILESSNPRETVLEILESCSS